MREWHVVAAALSVAWLFVVGTPLQPIHLAQGLVMGGVIGTGIAYLLRRMFPGEVSLMRMLRVTPTAVHYVASFLYELLTANLDVAYRVLAPSRPIRPDVVAIPLRVESPVAVTVLANSITLTPGTLTMDHDPSTNTLYVHGITGRDRDAVVQPVRHWEDMLLNIFEPDIDDVKGDTR